MVSSQLAGSGGREICSAGIVEFQNEPYLVPKVIGSLYQRGSCDVATPACLLAHQLLSHQPMQQIDRLERAHHHFEAGDPAIVLKRDDVDAVDPDPLNLFFEFEDGAAI